MKNKTVVFNAFQLALFMLYFVILTAERIISLCVAFGEPLSQMHPLDLYMTIFAVVSLAGGWLCLGIFGRRLFKLKQEKDGDDFLFPCVAAGILLLSGMVHTPGTVAPVQFASYGCLLLAMLLYTIKSVKEGGEPLLRVVSFIYITAFSMAIPVVYKTNCAQGTCALCTAFYPVECIASAGLVAVFTYMLISFYRSKSLLDFCPFAWAVAAVADALVLGLRWHDEINWFVLIFVSLSVAAGLVGKTLYCIRFHVKKKDK